jgi:protein-S-isoprenylcysteine O-methyltransferase Ste14
MTPIFLVGSGLVIAGSLLRIACFRALGKLFTFTISIRENHRLITNGPYSIVRHPSYIGLIANLVAGTPMVLFSAGSWMRECGVLNTFFGKGLFVAWLGCRSFEAYNCWSRSRVEDELMKKQFGDEWERWAKQTPYRLVPFLC